MRGALQGVEGVKAATFNFDKRLARVVLEKDVKPERLVEALDGAGFPGSRVLPGAP